MFSSSSSSVSSLSCFHFFFRFLGAVLFGAAIAFTAIHQSTIFTENRTRTIVVRHPLSLPLHEKQECSVYSSAFHQTPSTASKNVFTITPSCLTLQYPSDTDNNNNNNNNNNKNAGSGLCLSVSAPPCQTSSDQLALRPSSAPRFSSSLYQPPSSLSSLFHSRFGRDSADGVIERYVEQHGKIALAKEKYAALCQRKFLFTDCCGGNYGSSLYRMLAAVKMAMYFNLTFVIQLDYSSMNTFDFPFARLQDIQERLSYYRCPLNTPAQPASNVDIYHWHFRMEIPKSLYNADDAIACNQPAEVREKLPFYMWARCGDLSTIHQSKRHVFIQVGDDFDFFKAIELNKGYAASVDKDVQQHPMISRRLFILLVRPTPAIESIVEWIVKGEWFDFGLHLRGTSDPKNHEWDRQPSIDRARESANDLANVENPQWTKESSKYRNKRAYRYYVSAMNTDMKQLCIEVEANCETDHIQCKCEYFDEKYYIETVMKNNLPGDLVPFGRNEQADWGDQPRWVPIVNLFVFRYVKHIMWTICYSRFGQMIGVAANMRLSDEVSHKHNCLDLYWKF